MRLWRMVALCWLMAAGALRAQSLHYEGAATVARGNYLFTVPTTTFTLSTGLALGLGPVTLRATFPGYLQNTTLLSGTGTGVLPTGGGRDATGALRDSSMARKGGGKGSGGSGMGGMGSPAMTSAAGSPVQAPTSAVTGYRSYPGDPTLQLAYAPQWSGPLSLGIAVSAKVPATDTTQLGTGRWDVGVSAFVSRRVGRSFAVSVDAGYWRLGDLPGLDLQNPWMGSLSLHMVRPGGWGASLSASGARSVVAGFQDAYSVGAGILKMLGHSSVGVNGTAGLTETTPAFTLGLSWRVALAGQ